MVNSVTGLNPVESFQGPAVYKSKLWGFEACAKDTSGENARSYPLHTRGFSRPLWKREWEGFSPESLALFLHTECSRTSKGLEIK